MRVLVYTRMSNRIKEKLQKQLDSVLYFCEYMGYEVDKVFKESFSVTYKDGDSEYQIFEDYSNELRKEFNKMIEYIQDGDLIIMQTVSRLSRQGRIIFQGLMDNITEKGANIYFIIEDIITSEDNREAILKMADMARKNDYRLEDLKEAGNNMKSILDFRQQRGKKIDEKYIQIAIKDYISRNGSMNKKQTVQKYKISRPTFDKYLNEYKQQQKNQS